MTPTTATERVKQRVAAREALDAPDPMAEADLEHGDAQAHVASLTELDAEMPDEDE